jgi:hypothetical protein
MGGGLMQLVAYGAQDIYLTGNPQITFFKVVYRRHTNFAVESIEQTFNGQVDFGKRVTATISRNGDLIQQMYLEVVLPAVTAVAGSVSNVWVYGIGNALVKQAEIEIGGQLIDRQYGDWMNIWTELTVPEGKRSGYDVMVGNLVSGNDQSGDLDFTVNKRLYVPLQFWFNRNPGLALPLIALQYHEVKLNLEVRGFADLTNTTTGAAAQPSSGFICKLYVDYIYLDTDERRRFAQVSHEYLIEQVQFTGTQTISSGSTTKNITLNFNHPVKELIWAHISTLHNTSGYAVGNNAWFNYSGVNSTSSGADTVSYGGDSFQTGLLQLNGHDRFSVRSADYFRKVQNYDHHTRVPRVGKDLQGKSTAQTSAGNLLRKQYIYTYSFALSPEEHQPSGTCNFSRIDNAVLQLTYNPNTSSTGASGVDSTGRDYQPALYSAALNLNIYAVNYNVLRIMSGMGGLAYSN